MIFFLQSQVVIYDIFFVCSLPCRGLLTEPKVNMSCTALRELLIRELGQEDATRFSDVHLQNLIDKGYTDHGALKDATRDGLQSPPPLLPALVDKLLKCFKPAGKRRVYGSVNDSSLQLLLAKESYLLAKEKALERGREKDLLQQRAALWATSVANVLEFIGHSVVSVHAEPGDCLCMN